MNKLKIKNDEIILQDIDNSIDLEFDQQSGEFAVSTLKFIVKKSTRLELDYCDDNLSKFDIFITVLEDNIFDFFETRKEGNFKTRYKYFVEENATINVTKFFDSKEVRDMNVVYLNGYNASVNYLGKTINKSEQQLDIVVHHKYNKTNSEIINHGVNINEGTLNINVTSIVPFGISECKANQFSRIINQTQNRCLITPNLLIEGNTSEAEHSAFIGGFKSEELFYMQSRGITTEVAEQLLINGFLMDKINADEDTLVNLQTRIKKYWE